MDASGIQSGVGYASAQARERDVSDHFLQHVSVELVAFLRVAAPFRLRQCRRARAVDRLAVERQPIADLRQNPARLFRLGHRKGALELGRDADITVMAHKPGRYDAAASGHNVVHWSPYQGMDLTYRPAATFLRG